MKSCINLRVRSHGLLANCPKSERRRGPGYLKALALLCFFLLAAPFFGQAPAEPPVTATLTFANGQSINIGSNTDQLFPPITISTGETIGIQLQLPPTFVNTPVGIGSLDGGMVPDTIQVAPDGSSAFTFQAGSQPGLYRIVLNTATTSTMLEFLVPNAGNP